MATAPEPGKGPSAQLVKELRDKTGAGFADCRAALIEANLDMEQALNVLRKKGQVAAAKKAQRATSEGLVSSYVHAGGKIGVLVEINCESDIAALDPHFVRREEVTPEILEVKRVAYREEARANGKPDAVIEKIVVGKLE